MGYVTLAIDAGTGRKLGWAAGLDGRLFCASNGAPPKWIAPDRIVWEKPQVYPQGKATSKGKVIQIDPNDLIDLAIRTAYVVKDSAVPHTTIEEFRPSKWKGQVPKDIHHGRVWETLDLEERLDLERMLGRVPKTYKADVLDGVALLLWAYRRLLPSGY